MMFLVLTCDFRCSEVSTPKALRIPTACLNSKLEFIFILELKKMIDKVFAKINPREILLFDLSRK